MNKILITTSSFGANSTEPLDLLRNQGLIPVTNPHGKTLSEAQVQDLIREHRPCALLAGVEPLTRSVMDAGLPELRVISRCGTGMDNVNLDAAKLLGIAVRNTPEAPAEAVAELTLGLILSLIRNISTHDQCVKSGRWEKKMGFLLSELTFGIIGLGRVGKRVASLLKPFHCRILASDIQPDSDFIERNGIELLSHHEILKAADVVTLHLSYASGELQHFIRAETLGLMKKGSYLINTSRGALIEEAALVDALKSGLLAGAALDVYEQEPYQGPLASLPNALLSTHTGSYARGTRIHMEIEAAQNLIDALRK